MSEKRIPLMTGCFYHVFNRGVARMPIFLNRRSYKRALNSMFYYQNSGLKHSYSDFLKLPSLIRKEVLFSFCRSKKRRVEILSYCLMPNHFHCLVKQSSDQGISRFISDFTNSYTRYFNIKFDRVGAVFQGRFKAVAIESEEQLLHVSRYIHLNPYTSNLVNNIDSLTGYEFSSLKDYMCDTDSMLSEKEILHYFMDRNDYVRFVVDHADYQRNLHSIRHLTIE